MEKVGRKKGAKTFEGNRREAIKEEAMRLFVERGMDVGLREIAEACEMSTPNFYAHFSSKVDLVCEMFREGYAAYADAMNTALSAEEDFQSRLLGLITAVCALYDTDPIRFRFLLISQHGVLAGIDRNGMDNPVHVLREFISQSMDGGDIPAGEPELITSMVLGVLLQPATFIVHARLQATMMSLVGMLNKACLQLMGI